MGDWGNQAQQHRRLRSNALHLGQQLHRRGEHAGKASKPVHQGMRQGIHIPSGDGVIEQQLQGLVVGEAVQFIFQKALPHPVPVPVVDAHKRTSLVSSAPPPAAAESERGIWRI